MQPTEGANRSLRTHLGVLAGPANLSGKADSGGSLGTCAVLVRAPRIAMPPSRIPARPELETSCPLPLPLLLLNPC